jgi:hypothetical protein
MSTTELCPDCGKPHAEPTWDDVKEMAEAAVNSADREQDAAKDAASKGAPIKATVAKNNMEEYAELALTAASFALDLTEAKAWRRLEFYFWVKMVTLGHTINLTYPVFTAICKTMHLFGFSQDKVDRVAAIGYRFVSYVLLKITHASKNVVEQLAP